MTKDRIQWTEEEWDRLAKLVWNMRKNIPEDGIVALTKRALEQFPQNRRRPIRVSKELAPLIEKLTQMDTLLLDTANKADNLERRLEQIKNPSIGTPEPKPVKEDREEILNNLSDEEVVVRYSDRLFALLTPNEVLQHYSPETLIEHVPVSYMTAHLLQKAIETFSDKGNLLTGLLGDISESLKPKVVPNVTVVNKPSIPLSRTPIFVRPTGKTKLPKVTIIGLLPNQTHAIKTKLAGRAEFNFVDKNRTTDLVPAGQDYVLVALDFVNHAMVDTAKKSVPANRFFAHSGGITRIVEKLDSILPKESIASG